MQNRPSSRTLPFPVDRIEQPDPLSSDQIGAPISALASGDKRAMTGRPPYVWAAVIEDETGGCGAR